MYNNYDYPLGADCPDAPWNQPSLPIVDKAYEFAERDAQECEYDWYYFIVTKLNLEDEEEEKILSICKEKAADSELVEAFFAENEEYYRDMAEEYYCNLED